MLNTVTYRRFLPVVHFFISELIKLFKLQVLLGSKAMFFSMSHCFFPLIGLWGGATSSLIAYTLRTLLTLNTLGLGIIPLLYHIPTFCGALYLSSTNPLVRLGMPVICLMLFNIHPIGSQAVFYSLYWFIPLIVALFNPRSIFLQTLASTFTTHAVGSVIWLYCYNLDLATWQMLTAIVWAERLMIALGMTLIYHVSAYLKVQATHVLGFFKTSSCCQLAVSRGA